MRRSTSRLELGFVTGLNKAFVIDQDTRDWLLAQDPHSAEIIKPWLRGRNVKRWQVEWTGQYLLWTYQGIAIEEYPAVLEHLSRCQEQLSRRWEPNHGQCEWYELRPCDYYAEFEKPKILYPDIAKRCEFTYDERGFYGGNTVYFIPISDLVLLGILNSRSVEFFYQQISSMIQQDYLRFFTQYLSQVPVPETTTFQRATIESLVRKLLDVHRKDLTGLADPSGLKSQIAQWERELNTLVYQAYGLTEEEIAIIEKG